MPNIWCHHTSWTNQSQALMKLPAGGDGAIYRVVYEEKRPQTNGFHAVVSVMFLRFHFVTRVMPILLRAPGKHRNKTTLFPWEWSCTQNHVASCRSRLESNARNHMQLHTPDLLLLLLPCSYPTPYHPHAHDSLHRRCCGSESLLSPLQMPHWIRGLLWVNNQLVSISISIWKT